MLTAIIFPGLVKRLIERLAARIARRNPRAAARMEKLNGAWIGRTTVCAHSGPQRGCSRCCWPSSSRRRSHANKLLAGYVTLRVLGIPADFTDILLLQTLISFLLYFAPTPGGSDSRS